MAMISESAGSKTGRGWPGWHCTIAPMRYYDFRDTLVNALRDARLRFVGDPRETIDLTTTSRQYEAFLEEVTVQRAEPFYVAASVSFEWDPFESARTYTNEDDLITELLGRDDEPIDTRPRRLRVDFVLKASLPHGTAMPMLGADRWRSWSRSVHERLDSFLSTDAPEHRGRSFIVTEWRGMVAAELVTTAAGDAILRAVSLPSWQSVILPRVRDSVDEPEVDVDRQLEVIAGRYRHALDAWTDGIAELSR